MKRTVLVTGASGAIGREVARAFVLAGDRVALGCHSRVAETEACCAAWRAEGLDALCLPFDATSPTDCREALRRLGPAEVLIHCAGTSLRALTQDTTDDDWRAQFALHMDAPFYLLKALLPHWIERQAGCLLLLSSIWGQVGGAMEAAYSAAKAAQIGWAKALAKELGPSGIRVNCVCPGLIDTPMNQNLSRAELNAFAEELPLGRMGSAREVALACLFLAGDGARYITGQALGVNGGYC